MNPTFIRGNDLLKGDLFVRPFGNVPGKHPSLALIRVVDLGERGNGALSIIGDRALPDEAEAKGRAYSIPDDLYVLLLERNA